MDALVGVDAVGTLNALVGAKTSAAVGTQAVFRELYGLLKLWVTGQQYGYSSFLSSSVFSRHIVSFLPFLNKGTTGTTPNGTAVIHGWSGDSSACSEFSTLSNPEEAAEDGDGKEERVRDALLAQGLRDLAVRHARAAVRSDADGTVVAAAAEAMSPPVGRGHLDAKGRWCSCDDYCCCSRRFYLSCRLWCRRIMRFALSIPVTVHLLRSGLINRGDFILRHSRNFNLRLWVLDSSCCNCKLWELIPILYKFVQTYTLYFFFNLSLASKERRAKHYGPSCFVSTTKDKAAGHLDS